MKVNCISVHSKMQTNCSAKLQKLHSATMQRGGEWGLWGVNCVVALEKQTPEKLVLASGEQK